MKAERKIDQKERLKKKKARKHTKNIFVLK